MKRYRPYISIEEGRASITRKYNIMAGIRDNFRCLPYRFSFYRKCILLSLDAFWRFTEPLPARDFAKESRE